MIYGIYSVRDSATGFLNISLDVNDKAAIRNFGHACKNTDSLFFTHSSDYTLYKLGEFDTDNGEIINEAIPKRIICADEFERR